MTREAPAKPPYFDSLLASIEYIEANLKARLTIKAAAEASGYSLHHYCHLFSHALGLSPYDYIMRRKLTQAAEELLASDRKIIDIALDYGFSCPEVFSRAFRKMFGKLPHQFRAGHPESLPAYKDRPTRQYLEHIAANRPFSPTLTKLETLHLEGRVWLAKNLEEMPPGLQQGIAALPAAAAPHYLLLLHPACRHHPDRLALLGARTAPPPAGPALFAITIPAQKYASFTHNGDLGQLELTFEYIYQTWLPKSGQRSASPYALITLSAAPVSSVAVPLG